MEEDKLSLRIDYLVTFVTAVELGAFAKAAKKLEITDGGVSHQMRALERYFGVKLFIKNVKRAELTEEGKIIFNMSKGVLDQLENTRRSIIHMKEIVTGSVKIAASTIPGEHVIPRLINEYKEKYPNVELVVQISDSKTAFDKLRSGEADLAAVGTTILAPKDLEYETMQIAEERLVLIVAPNHELARKESISIKEIPSLPFISRERGSGTKAEIERFLGKSGLDISKLKIRMELGSTGSIITAVSEGIGVSIISENAAKKAEKAQLIKILQLIGIDHRRKLYLVRNLCSEFSKPARLLWNYAESVQAFTKIG
jgi:DNA-binding transcriptional LysR family regulator